MSLSQIQSRPRFGVVCLGLLLACSSMMAVLVTRADSSAPDSPGQEPVLAEQRLYWADAANGVEILEESPELLAKGRGVYEQRCGSCHGLGGRGNGAAAAYLITKPRDFTTSNFKLRTTSGFPTDTDLFRTITVGFPAYGMPEFDYLSIEERWGLVHYVKFLGREGYRRELERDLIQDELDLDPDVGLTPEVSAKFTDELAAIRKDAIEIAEFKFEAGDQLDYGRSIPASPEIVARGKKVYTEWGCNKCHGDEGHGDGPSAADLKDDEGRKISARDFAMNRWYFKGGDRASDIARTLGTGMPGTPMPSFLMGPEYMTDLWRLAHYVENLRTSAEEARRK